MKRLIFAVSLLSTFGANAAVTITTCEQGYTFKTNTLNDKSGSAEVFKNGKRLAKVASNNFFDDFQEADNDLNGDLFMNITILDFKGNNPQDPSSYSKMTSYVLVEKVDFSKGNQARLIINEPLKDQVIVNCEAN